jgi:hypothetical protein
VNDNLRKFDKVRQEFMEIFEEEEVNIASKQKPGLASIIYKGWESDRVWFWRCLISTNAMISLVEDHICPRFSRLSSKAEPISLSIGVKVLLRLLREKSLIMKGIKRN